MNRAIKKSIPGVALLLATAVGGANVQAALLTVDGDLSDLMAAQSFTLNSASGSESGADAENNGFDITNYYSHYDPVSDTFYFGFATEGPVGDSCTPNDSDFGTCGVVQDSTAFDPGEAVKLQLAVGATSIGDFVSNIDVTLEVFGDNSALTGPDVGNVTAPSGVTVLWAVSEAFNGVEFSVAGLDPLSGGIPRDFGVRFAAGSGHNSGPEDEAYLFSNVVPVPAAVWLFGSGLIALGGLGRRRHQS